MKTVEYEVKLEGILPLLQGKKDPRPDEPPRSGPERDRWYKDQWRYTHYADREAVLGQPGLIIKAVTVRGMRETAKRGDADAGKGKTEQMARACLRIEPGFPKFDGGQVVVPENPPFYGPADALALDPADGTAVFVLERLCSRGVEVTNLGISGWDLNFRILDNSDGYFNPDWLQRGLEHGFGLIGMGTWRPDFGLARVADFSRVV